MAGSAAGCAGDDSGRARTARRYRADADPDRFRSTLQLTADATAFPVAMVNLLEETDQYTVSAVGVDDVPTMPRAQAICDTVVRTGRPLAVADTRADRRFREFPHVRNGWVGSFAGAPIRSRESYVVGSVCVVDARPRAVADGLVGQLVHAAAVLEDQWDLLRRRDPTGAASATAAEVLSAVRAGEIRPWYQPIVDLGSRRTVAYEALARWTQPSGVVRTPRSFLPAAQDSDLVVELDLAVLRAALADVLRWRRWRPALRLTVNLSGRHLRDPGAAVAVHEVATSLGVQPAALDLEFTGTGRAPELEAESVQRFRRLGYRVWSDNVGGEESPLPLLLHGAVDGIKIDRSLAAGLGTPAGSARIRALARFASDLGVRVALQGIETPAQATEAHRLGCEHGQGYLWSAPRPPEVVQRMVRYPFLPVRLHRSATDSGDGAGR
ncbi:sensor domain-containing phosphodiesterase [Nakamurella endophytica]|uniref:EAL domain-containing protein n=1 Tax=Nakamurella endophytica TaxID=1748367 RepID=A0A917T8Z3_9ACTN|nr:EAL domain-containing protein [Nakamurella endophytica]GGM13759.1 hypothetical protein GCM10011594_37060 [Nakamurella endophytica]